MLYLTSHRMPSRLVGDSENSGWQLVGSEPRRFLTTANNLRNTLPALCRSSSLEQTLSFLIVTLVKLLRLYALVYLIS